MKAVIFDLGHTLIDYYTDWKDPEGRAIQETFRIAQEKGCLVGREEFHRILSYMLEEARQVRRREMREVSLESLLNEFFERVGCTVHPDLMERSLEAFYGALLEHRKLIPGSGEMLDRIKQRGYRIGLVSDVAFGLPSRFPLRDVEFYSLDRYFDDMVFSTDVGLRKPHPGIFHVSLENLGVDACDAVYVGNSLQADIQGALSSGIGAVLKRSNFYFHDDGIRPHAVVDEWWELDPLLDSLLG
ncbi:MAG: HAD family hydrolase [Methanomassiliicoccales archaeon]